MDIRVYTDEKYIPLSQLKTLGNDFFDQTTKYRESFLQVIQLDDFSFANITETPILIKKRFVKNVEIASKIKIDSSESDFILLLAKIFVTKTKNDFVNIKENIDLLKMYEQNNRDLTIVTNYIIENIWNKDVITWKNYSPNKGELKMVLPELSRYEQAFAQKYHQIKHHYTLQDFQELNKTSYETARKSMEKLRKLKLYLKSKVGKKYVYEPTEKLLHALKGGV